LTSGFPSLWVSSPNAFPNILQPVLQWDNANRWERSDRNAGLSRRRARV
jgi:hypothetical protein